MNPRSTQRVRSRRSGGERLMVRYFYAWIPLAVLFGTVTLMVIPYLAVIVLLALVVAVMAVIGGLVWTAASALYGITRSALSSTAPAAPREGAETTARIALDAGGAAGGGAR